MLLEVPYKDGETVSEVVNAPYDIVGVHTPSGAVVSGPYTVEAGPKADDTGTVTYNGAAVPQLDDHDCIDVQIFAAWDWVTLTAGGAASADGSIFLICRNFHP